MNRQPSSEHAGKAATGTATQPAWSLPVNVAEIPEGGQRIELVADERTRELLARAAGVVALPRLEAEFELTQQGTDGVHLTGRVAATVVQNCVVTLDPIESEMDEAVDLVFMPTAAPEGEVAGVQALDVGDLPETLHNGVVDLGAVAIEFLLLGIDPYPRKPGAVFEAPPAGDPSGHPFAALAALKKDGGPKDR